MSGIYVHIPFCKRKCLYCDFYSLGERLAAWPLLVKAICREAEMRILPSEVLAHDSPLTLYIGGGTPSLIPAEEFHTLASFLINIVGQPVEFTLEVNPDDVTPEKVKAWQRAGVNRISMGVQSLVDSELLVVGRRHSAFQAISAFEMLRKEFSNISLDLIFGLPGQTIQSLGSSLDGLINLGPEHISIYSLMFEERTALTRMRDSGMIGEVPEEDSEAMFSLVCQRLRQAGYERYEISNYAKPGFRSKHNSAYWNGIPYIGLGPAAHSYDGIRSRSANIHDVNSYLAYYGCNGADSCSPIPSPFEACERIRSVEYLTDDELREEMIMTRLRTREGLSISEFSNRFGCEAATDILAQAKKWIATGDLSGLAENKLYLTDKGVMISDEIIASLF